VALQKKDKTVNSEDNITVDVSLNVCPTWSSCLTRRFKLRLHSQTKLITEYIGIRLDIVLILFRGIIIECNFLLGKLLHFFGILYFHFT